MRSELFNQQNAERETNQRWTMQSKKMLRALVAPNTPMIATKGAMVAYQGNVEFDHQGSGSFGNFIKKAATGENAPMMRVQGHGEVFFAREASNIFMLQLEGPNDGLTVNSSSLLAFDACLNWEIKRIKGMGALVAGAGLFNVVLSGVGNAAVCCKGEPLILDCSRQPTFVDPQAAVCWSANLEPGIKNDMKLGSLIGRGSGEAFQLAFHGPGFVVVQPAEMSIGVGTAS